MHDQPMYHLEGQFDEIIMIGAVADGVRSHSHFSGTIVSGELAGATMTGVDYFRIRPDGVGVVDGYELVRYGSATVSVRLTGYILPPSGMPAPPAEMLADPGFTWPDVEFSIAVLATFVTAAPELAHLNRTAAIHSGTVNMATGRLDVHARSISPHVPVTA